MKNHTHCMACGAPIKNEQQDLLEIYCEKCTERVLSSSYAHLDYKEWDDSYPLSLFDAPDERFFTYEDIEWYCAEYGYDINKLRLISCRKVDLPKIQLKTHLKDWLPEDLTIEDIDPHGEIEDAVNNLLNDKIKLETWVPTKYRVDLPK